jgi:DNA-binding transcriptional regulator YiaG
MPNLSQILKAEIARLSRKEIRASVSPLRSSNFTLKRTVAELKKKIAILESNSKRLAAMQSDIKEKTGESAAAQGADGKIRITSKTVKSLRNKLGLSQDSFASLLGVSGQSVYVMERKGGKLRLRGATLAKFTALRGIGKREALRRVEELGKDKVTKPRGRKPAKKK